MSVGSGDYIKRPDENEPTVDKDEQELYRSGVGMLLYLVKFSRPGRELSKVMDGATTARMKFFKKVIKYVIDTNKESLMLM